MDERRQQRIQICLLIGIIISAIAAFSIVVAGWGATGSISGQIVDANNKPVAGVMVEAWQNSYRPFHLSKRVAEVQTDSQGRFKMVLPERADYLTGGGMLDVQRLFEWNKHDLIIEGSYPSADSSGFSIDGPIIEIDE